MQFLCVLLLAQARARAPFAVTGGPTADRSRSAALVKARNATATAASSDGSNRTQLGHRGGWVLLPPTAKAPYSRDVFCHDSIREILVRHKYEPGTARVRCSDATGLGDSGARERQHQVNSSGLDGLPPQRQRDLGGTCKSDSSWRYAWQGIPLLDADKMCALANGIKLVIMGDSLSMQLHASWMARLRAAGYNTCPQTSTLTSVVGPGTAILIKQMKPWIVASSWTSSDFRGEKCAAEFRASAMNSSSGYEHSSSFVRADGMLSQLISSKEHTGATNSSQSRKIRVVYNAYAHLHLNMIRPLAECYNRTGLSDVQSKALAVRDALTFWRGQVVAVAGLFKDVRNRAKLKVPPIDVRTFYRTSPRAADQLHAMDGASSPLSSAAATLEHDFTTPPEKMEYSHHVYQAMNDMAVSAFSACGHGIIDTEVMMGMRVDAHPASVQGDFKAKQKVPGQSDTLHFCMPGVPDYALDVVLRSL